MSNGRRFGNSTRTSRLWAALAVVATGTIWTLYPMNPIGAQSQFNGWSHTLGLSRHRPVATVIGISGTASVRWNGRTSPLALGSRLEVAELVVTGAHSTVVVRTPDGAVFRILPGSHVRFCANRWISLDRVNRWLNRIKTLMQRFGGEPPSDRISSPTAVITVRAAVLPPPEDAVTEVEERCVARRRRA